MPRGMRIRMRACFRKFTSNLLSVFGGQDAGMSRTSLISLPPASCRALDASVWHAADIAGAADGLDVAAAASRHSQLLAQVADMHVNAALERRKGTLQRHAHQFLAADHASGTTQQDLQDSELDDGEPA